MKCQVGTTLKRFFFYKKNFYEKISLKNLKKMLSKFPASNALVTTFTNLELFKKYKTDKILAFLESYLKLFSVFIINGSTIFC